MYQSKRVAKVFSCSKIYTVNKKIKANLIYIYIYIPLTEAVEAADFCDGVPSAYMVGL